MSEFSSKENANRLIGAPPGTVGYEEGGVLTEAVKRHPYSIVLLDEFEKADPNVWKLFLQVFDAGQLTDNQGTTVNFKNTIFVMTTNMGAEVMYGKAADDITDDVRDEVRERLMTRMPRELFLRIDDVTVFDPLRREHARLIVRKVFNDTRKRFLEAPAQICEIGDITMSEDAVDHLIENGFEADSGARAVQSFFDRNLVSLLSRSILEAPSQIERLHVDVEDDQFIVRV
jgi:ATP-dependent Clp protease ATP-binding subunit ClpB